MEGFKIRLTDEMVDEIVASVPGRFSVPLFRKQLTKFVSGRLRQINSEVALEVVRFYVNPENELNDDILYKALNYSGKKEKDKGIYFKNKHDTYLINLLSFYAFNRPWNKFLEERGIRQEELIVDSTKSIESKHTLYGEIKSDTELIKSLIIDLPKHIQDQIIAQNDFIGQSIEDIGRKYDASLFLEVSTLKETSKRIEEKLDRLSSTLEQSSDSVANEVKEKTNNFWKPIQSLFKPTKQGEQIKNGGIIFNVELLLPNVYPISKIHFDYDKAGYVEKVCCWFKCDIYSDEAITIKSILYSDNDIGQRHLLYLPTKKLNIVEDGVVCDEPFELPLKIPAKELVSFYVFLDVHINTSNKIQNQIYKYYKERFESLPEFLKVMQMIERKDDLEDSLFKGFKKNKEYLIATTGMSHHFIKTLGIDVLLPNSTAHNKKLPYSEKFGVLEKGFHKRLYDDIGSVQEWHKEMYSAKPKPYEIHLKLADGKLISHSVQKNSDPFWFFTNTHIEYNSKNKRVLNRDEILNKEVIPFIKIEDYDGAKTKLLQLYEIHKWDKDWDYFFYLGSIERKIPDFNLAIKHLSLANVRYPNQFDIIFLLSTCLNEIGDFKATVTLLSEIVQKMHFPDDASQVSLRYKLAESYFSLDQFDKAIDQHDLILALLKNQKDADHTHAIILFDKCLCLAKNNQLDEARILLKDVKGDSFIFDETNPEILFLNLKKLVYIYQLLKNTDDQLQTFYRMLVLTDVLPKKYYEDRARVRINIALMLAEKREHSHATLMAKEIVTEFLDYKNHNPFIVDLYKHTAIILNNADMIDESISYIELAIANAKVFFGESSPIMNDLTYKLDVIKFRKTIGKA